MLSKLQKGAELYRNKSYIWKVIESCNTLIGLLPQNMDEFPDMKSTDMYMLCETLIALKWSAIELLGREMK